MPDIFDQIDSPPSYGTRTDGSPKGRGYYGELPFHDGRTSTELSTGINFDGQEREIPLLVPGLRKDQIDHLLQGNAPTPEIVQAAVGHARKRLAFKQDPFAQEGEQSMGSYGDIFDQIASSQPSSTVARGGVGQNLDPIRARQIADQRVMQRANESGQRNVVLDENGGVKALGTERISQAATLARNFSSGISFGVTGARDKILEDLLVKFGVLTPEQQATEGIDIQNKENATSAVVGNTAGQMISALLPAGATAKAPTFLRAVGTGMGYGGVAGASSALAEKGLDTSAGDIVESTAKGAGTGALFTGGAVGVFKGVPAVAKAVASPLKTLEGLGWRSSTKNLAQSIINPTSEAEKAAFTSRGKNGLLDRGFQVIRDLVGKPKNLDTLIQKGEMTQKNLGAQIDAFQSLNQDLTTSGSQAAQKMRSAVQTDITLTERDPEVVQAVLKNASFIDKEMSLTEGFQRLREINARHKNYFNATANGQATKLMDAEYKADEIMRHTLSDQMDALVKAKTGKDSNFYRDYGLVSDVTSHAQKNLNNLTVTRAKQVNEGFAPVAEEVGNITQIGTAARKAISLSRGGNLGTVDRNVAKLFDRLPATKNRILSPQERSSLMAQGQGKSTPPPVPRIPPVLSDVQNQRMASAIRPTTSSPTQLTGPADPFSFGGSVQRSSQPEVSNVGATIQNLRQTEAAKALATSQAINTSNQRIAQSVRPSPTTSSPTTGPVDPFNYQGGKVDFLPQKESPQAGLTIRQNQATKDLEIQQKVQAYQEALKRASENMSQASY